MKIVNYIANFFYRFSVRINPELGKLQHVRVSDFYLKNGQNLLYDFNLQKTNTIIDLGGYVGDWTYEIFKRFNCRIFIFEPCSEYYDQIEKRFKMNSQIKPIMAGLGSSNKKQKIFKDGVSSSVYGDFNNSEIEIIEIINAKEFFEENSINRIDLLKINIEGGEFELLEFLIEEKLVDKIDNILVQFHENLIENANLRMAKIQSKLCETHRLTFQFPFVWENWKRL